MNIINPYEAPQAANVQSTNSLPRSRWSLLRWVPIASCLLVSLFGFALCVYSIGTIYRYLTIPGIRAHGSMNIRAFSIISMASLFVAVVGGIVAFYWKRYRWDRAVFGSIGLIALVCLLTWAMDSPWLFRRL